MLPKGIVRRQGVDDKGALDALGALDGIHVRMPVVSARGSSGESTGENEERKSMGRAVESLEWRRADARLPRREE